MASKADDRKAQGGDRSIPRPEPAAKPGPRFPDARWKRVLSAVNVGVLIVDAETHTIVDANPRAMEMIGAEREWVIGASCHRFICPAEKGKCPISDLNQKMDHCERTMLTAGGDERPVLKSVVPLTLDGRKVLLETLVDLSDARRIDEEARVLTTALHSAAAGVVVTDREGRILWANPSFSSITGYALSEVVGRKPSLVNSGKHDRAFFGDLWGTILEGKVWRGDVVNRRKDGTLYTEDMTITPVRMAGDAITHFIAVKHDVTERRKVESHLQRRWKHLHQILEHLPVMMVAMDEAGRLAVWNEECERVTGYGANEVVGNPDWEKLLYPDDLHRAEARALSERGGAAHRDWETRIRCRDGSTKTISWSRVGAQAPIPGYARWCLGRDVTEKTDLTRTLRNSERFLSSVFASIQDGICVMDRDLTVLRSNATMERWHPRQVPLIGKKCYEAFHQRGKPCEACPCRTVLQTGQPESCIIPRKDATGRITGWIRLNAFPLHDEESGELMGVIEYVRDITALREAEERVRWSHKMEGIGRLASGMAHDFNNLFAVIRGYCDLLEKELPPGSPSRSRTAHIHQATERAAALTRQLLLFSRREAPQPVALCLNDVITESLDLLRSTLGDRIELRVETDAKLHFTRADRAHVQQLLLNLVANAHDAMPSGGRVSLRTYNLDSSSPGPTSALHVQPGHYAVLEVEDTGHGMDDATQEHLFEPFFTTKANQNGAGMGLPVVYGIVSACHGYISVHSQPGRGSTFVVLLPEAPREESSPPPAVPLASPHGNGETLLLVEDEPSLRACMVELLKDAGFRVLDAADGMDALRLLQEGGVDLVLSDVMMPRMNGLELARRLSVEHPETRMVLFTGYANEETIRSSLDGTGIPLVRKPFEFRQLLAVLHSELAVRQVSRD